MLRFSLDERIPPSGRCSSGSPLVQRYVLQCSIYIAQILNGPLAHDQFNLTDYAADLGDVPYQVDQTSRLMRSALLYVGGNSTIWSLLVESRGV